MEIDQKTFMERLKEKFNHTDIGMVKRDVLPFVQNPALLDIWSNDYFLLLADRLRFLSAPGQKARP